MADPVDFENISLDELESQSIENQRAYWEWLRRYWLEPPKPDHDKPDDEAA